MLRKNVIIDCDPGADDAVALILALHSPELNVVGITTVSGVCPVDCSSENALKIAELCGAIDLPVVRGADHPLRGKSVFDSSFCGCDGLCETDLPKPKKSVYPAVAEDFIADTVERYHRNIHIISIAPMTNLALTFQRYPHITEGLSSIITSSGSYGVQQDGRDYNPRPSWNVAQDPKAAKIVMESGTLIEAVGLDVSLQFTNAMIVQLQKKMSRMNSSGRLLQKMIGFNLSHGLKPYSLLVDALAVAYAVRPELAQMIEGKIAVETKGEITMGQTLFGTYGFLDSMKSRAKVACSFQLDHFVNLLAERVLQ